MSKKHRIERLFIANRGEIAVRIVRACRKRGIEAVVAVSDADRDTLAARIADRAVCIGPPPASHSYLNMAAVVAAAKGTQCDAIHPGYGFLAERAAFARLCAEHDLVFVGPSPEAMEAMGDKLRARRIAEELRVPTIPGSDHVRTAQDALAMGERFGYPLLLKASAGGGGRGMRVVRAPEDVAGAFDGASAEARAAFGDPTLYLERYIERARHIEIQVIGDNEGNRIHLGERDCSTQRRHQKLIEEAPSPVIGPQVRSSMAHAALKLASHVGYTSAGTVEFIYDLESGNFYFLEMNTRIQVEHPVTEMITGVDLVEEQLRVAAGEALSIVQSDVQPRGHAIECRINAEAPERDFMPGPGTIARWQPPVGDGIRMDTHCYPGYFVPPFYDSMIAKLVVHAPDRAGVISKMTTALDTFGVDGLPTTIPFHRSVMRHPDFRENRVTTRWVEEELYRRRSGAKEPA